MAPPRNVVKIAVQMRDAIPQLIQLDQAKPLAAVLKEVCDAWSLTHSESYALQFAEGPRRYITENNRTEIKNGSILCLSTAPDLEAEQLLGGLQSGSCEGRREALRRLILLAPDLTFAREVISRDGLQRLGTIIEDGDDLGEVLALGLRAFSELMEHGVVSWETLSIPFVRKVVCYVNMNLMDASVQPLALGLLESVALSSPALGQLVKSEVPLDRLLVHLQVMNQQLQTKAMALLTALLQGASPAERKQMLDYLWQRNFRQFIYKALTLGLLEPRMRTPLDPYSQEQREQLQALRQAAFESEGEPPGTGLSADRRRSLCAREFHKLGFSNSNPAQDLERVPPGLLALDNMLYFSRHAPSAYSRFVLENSSREDKHECPFARSSIQLTVLLCDLLRIGEPCSETAQDFSPMFFGQDQSFHELFCVGIQLLNKTWKEMRATQEDFDKVMQVVREQLARTLALKPTSLELFRTKVNSLTYGEVLRLRQTERLHQEGTLAPPILELREKLKPELMGLIRQQRLLRLCEGTLFRKISSRRRQGLWDRGRAEGSCVGVRAPLVTPSSFPFLPTDKLWFCCLSPNHKVLQYGDVEEGAGPPAPESLAEQLPVADIRALLTGRDCPHVREKGSGKQNKDLCELAFSISYDRGEEEVYLNFIAPSKREFYLWTDGLSALLGSPMGSEQTRLDLEQLLTMETKLRLLELENVPIPERPPPVPPPPTNFNFCYDCSVAEP
ncbi:engulfment and cell motility protein 3 isoform X2 [Choloepus didactylus]|uniref:engulfment and cell motility protein 3 isoform X2 n=1 Tax=Choloepus didactylus TaxID=27675 RepID=UPI00189E92F0|nr:engulfment and cell motility protein 3 isoform X2 [Choloepus didactylus]